MKNFILVMVLAILFLGCNAKHCIKVSGEWKGINGDIEYCFDQAKTSQEGTPIFTSSDGKDLIGLTEQDLDKLALLIDKEEFSTKSVGNGKKKVLEYLKRK